MRSFYARVEHKAVVGVDIVNLIAITSLILIRRHRSSPRTSADSCCLLTMLTTREGGTTVSAPKHAEDVGINDLGDGGAAMRALRRSQPW